MAIKINWQDLKKRFINWQEIVRVYKAGYQVRPDTVPPTPIYTPWAYKKNWLISFSTDGIHWTTITDKNLWASNVFSLDDDPVVEKFTSWNIYQWWNNYGFPWAWGEDTITTSATQVDVTGYWPSNPYSSSTWITNDQWTTDSSAWRNLWDSQWPCPAGFHIPTGTEWTNMLSAFESIYSISSQTSANKAIYLSGTWYFVPVWHKEATTAMDDGTKACYWVSNVRERGVPWVETISTSGLNRDTTYGGQGALIRPFKDTPEVPDDTWEQIPLTWMTTRWFVVWNSTLGLMSVTNWVNVVTMADKNLWATTVYNGWDPVTDANAWLFYQWWNTNGFSYDAPSYTVSQTVENLTNYDVNNLYTSSDWHIWNDTTTSPSIWTVRNSWYTPLMQNLWWGYNSQTAIAQWPCPSWFHIMNPSEASLLTFVSGWTTQTLAPSYLKMPEGWAMEWTTSWLSTSGRWTSASYLLNFAIQLAINLNPTDVVRNMYADLSSWALSSVMKPNNYGWLIRPIKDHAFLPNDYDDWTVMNNFIFQVPWI